MRGVAPLRRGRGFRQTHEQIDEVSNSDRRSSVVAALRRRHGAGMLSQSRRTAGDGRVVRRKKNYIRFTSLNVPVLQILHTTDVSHPQPERFHGLHDLFLLIVFLF